MCVRERELTNDWRSALLGWPSGASLMLRGRSLSQQAKYSAPRGSTKPCARSMWWAMGLTILDRRLNAKSSYYIPCVWIASSSPKKSVASSIRNFLCTLKSFTSKLLRVESTYTIYIYVWFSVRTAFVFETQDDDTLGASHTTLHRTRIPHGIGW